MVHALRTGVSRIRPNLPAWGLVLAAMVGSVIACDSKPPTAPSIPPPSSPPPPAVVGLEISAPARLEPGATAQLTAIARKSDGSSEDVASKTSWTSTSGRVLTVSATGLAKGEANGEVSVNARYQNRFASARILVLPDGTYRLTGRISESGFGLEKVTVTVLSGVGEGLSSVTLPGGTYTLYGVSGSIKLRASRTGYADKFETVDVTADRSFDFEVAADRPRANLAGTYSLDIQLAPCQFTQGAIPQAVQKRSYSATVAQDGARLTVTLGGADFVVTRGRGDRFSGFLEPEGAVSFGIGDVYYDYEYGLQGQHDFVERLSDTSVYIVEGVVAATASPSGISGTLSGTVELATGTTAPFTFNLISARCYANTHRFEMVRQ